MSGKANLDMLLDGPIYNLGDLPRSRGIYALADHTGQTRYIGKAVDTDFRNRIFSRHTTGSEENSHKFSHSYNTGRLWRAKRDSGSDAKLAKDLRTKFIRKFCKARILPINGDAEQISRIEIEMIELSPPSYIEWNNRREHRLDEPTELLNQFLKEIEASNSIIEAINRQQKRFIQAMRAAN